MAVPIGPWIDVTLVLLGALIVHVVYFRRSSGERQQVLAYSAHAGALGGSIATACGFSFPTLYFLDPTQFAVLLQEPFHFMSLLFLLIVCAGGFGMAIAYAITPWFLADERLTFPVSTMVYSTLSAQHNIRQGYQLMRGLIASSVISIAQLAFKLIPEKLALLSRVACGYIIIPALTFRTEWIAMLWAIGFVTGHVIALPLLIGAVIKIFVADPLRLAIFDHIGVDDFLFAFCSGIVTFGAVLSLRDIPSFLHSFMVRWKKIDRSTLLDHVSVKKALVVGFSVLALGLSTFLFWCNFSILSQFYLLGFTGLCVYQVALIAAKSGLAPIGRFATWVMVPGLLLFALSDFQVTIVSAFVEISCMVAVTVLTGKKMGQLAHLSEKKLTWYHVLGLILSAILTSAIFYVLIQYCGLGATSPLIAQRCQSRALLVHASSFNMIVLLCGIVCGMFLHLVRVNSTMVLGGLLLPIDFSLLLIAGGVSTYLVPDKERYYPFWSGVFASSALWVVIRALIYR